MRKFAFIFFAATILCINFACSINKLVSVKTIKGIKSTTIPIVCGSITGDKFKITKIIGSAFFINDEGYFLTAGHVFNDWEKIDKSGGECFPAIYTIIGGWQADTTNVRWFRFENCRRNKVADIAVCKPQDNPFLTEDVKRQINFVTFTKSPQSREDGTPIAFTGFPLNFLRPITAKGNIASYVKAVQTIIIDNNAWPGASGSPVYRYDGQVIGIIIKRGKNEGIGLAYARVTESIIEFLTRNKIKFHQKE